MTFKAILQRFSQKLKRIIKNTDSIAFPIENIPLITTPDPQSSLQEQQLITISQHYQQDPATYLDAYLKILKNYIQYLQQTDNKKQLPFYVKQLLDTYEGLTEQQLEHYALDYADALMDYALCLADVDQETKYQQQIIHHYQQLDKKDLELYDSFYLTALDCYINSLDKTENPQQAIATSQEMLQVSKRAMQQADNIQRQQEYLYCLDNYLLLHSQLTEPVEPPQTIASYYREALTLYQKFYEQGTGYERLYADLLTRYNQFLEQQQQLTELITYNQHIIDNCIQSFNQQPENFTGYLYSTCLKQLANYLEKSHNLPLAQHLFKQAINLFQNLLTQDPSDEISQANCAYVLTQYAQYLAQSDHIEEAIPYSQQSVELYIQLLSQHPQYELASEKALIQYQILTGQI